MLADDLRCVPRVKDLKYRYRWPDDVRKVLPRKSGWLPKKGRPGTRRQKGERQERYPYLRHTFCSHLAMREAPARAIQELAGHSELGVTQRYMHLVRRRETRQFSCSTAMATMLATRAAGTGGARTLGKLQGNWR